MSNIYEISEWANSTPYRKNEIVYVGGSYYYCVNEHTSIAAGTFPSTDLTKWNGYARYESTGEDKPLFLWIPSYNITANNAPKVKSVRFGDGWEQRMEDGINNALLEFDVSFDNRDLFEAAAIAHFLNTRAGAESFIWYPPSPYYARKLWVCDSHSLTINFYNNYTVKGRFREVIY